MADIANLVIRVSTTGSEQAKAAIDQVKNAGKQAAATPIKFRIDVSSVQAAVAQLEALKSKGLSGAGVAINVKTSGVENVADTYKQIQSAMVQTGTTAAKLNVYYDEGAAAAKRQADAVKAAAAEQQMGRTQAAAIAEDIRRASITDAAEKKRLAQQDAADRRAAMVAAKEEEKVQKGIVAFRSAMNKQQVAEEAITNKARAAAVAQEIKDKEKLAAAQEKAHAATQRQAERAAADLANQKGMITTLNDHLLRMARIIASVAVAFFLLRGAINIFKELLDTVDEFNLTTIGVASTLTDLSKDQSNPQQNFIQNLSYARDMYVELENAAVKFFASGAELIQAWNILSQQGILLQREQIDNLGVIVDKIKLLTVGQVSSVQIAQELRAALMGQARPTDQLARLVKDRLGGAWKEVFKQVKETQSLEPLAKLFSGLEIARPFIQETLMSQLTTLWTNLRQITRTGMADPYADVVRYMKEWNIWLKENKKEVSEGIKSAWDSVKFVLEQIEGALSRIKSLLSDPVMMTALGVVLGGMSGGTVGAAIGGVGGLAIGSGALSKGGVLTEMLESQQHSKEITKEAKNEGVGFWTSLGYAISGQWEKANEAATKYEAIINKSWQTTKKMSESKLPEIPIGMEATPLSQRERVWDDKSIKALQTATNLVTSMNQQLSDGTGNATAKIAADFGKIDNQITKVIFKLREANETQKLAIEYEQKLRDIRDKIITQQLEKQNREIYAYSLEGVPETLENQFKKIQLARDEFKRKYETPFDAEKMIGEDLFLRVVESAKDASEVMETAAERWGKAWKFGMEDVAHSLNEMKDKIDNLFKEKVPGLDEFVNQFKNLTGGGSSGEDPLKKYLQGKGFNVVFTDLDVATPIQKGIQENLDRTGSVTVNLPSGSLSFSEKNNLSIQNKNLFNLVYAGQAGAAPGVGHGKSPFAAFDTYESGIEAGLRQIELYQSRHLTVQKLQETYAPGFENPNLGKRIRESEQVLGVSRDTDIATIPRDAIARLLLQQEVSGKMTGTFAGLKASADAKLTESLGGRSKTEVADSKAIYAMDLASIAAKMKIDEILKSSYSTLASMNIPAERQNEYSKKALELELMIDQAKTEQVIKVNGLDEATANVLRQNNNALAVEKERVEAINQQVRPLEQQKTWLSQVNSYVSKIASDSVLFTDQLEYQEQSLQIQQEIGQKDLDIWIAKNKEALKSSGFDEERLRSLHKQSQEAEKLKFEMSKWEGQGPIGGAKIYGVERANEAAKRGATEFKSMMNSLESTLGDTLGTVFMDTITGKKTDLKAMFEDLLGDTVKSVFKSGIARGFDLIGDGINALTGVGKGDNKGESAGGLLGGLLGKGALGSTEYNPMYVEVVGLGMGKLGPAMPTSGFDRTMQRMDKTAYTIGGIKGEKGKKGNQWEDEFDSMKKYQKQYERFYKIRMKDEKALDKFEDRDYKEDVKQMGGYMKLYDQMTDQEQTYADTYALLQDQMIEENQNKFTQEYTSMEEYQTGFATMATNVTSVWGIAQGLMTAAGVSGEAARYGSMVSYGMKGVSFLMQLAKSKILIDAYQAAASAFRWVMATVPPPANFPLAIAAAGITFAAVSAYGAMGGVTSGFSGGGDSGAAVEASGYGGFEGRMHSGGHLPPYYAHNGFPSLKSGEVPFIGLDTERVLNPRQTYDYEAGMREAGGHPRDNSSGGLSIGAIHIDARGASKDIDWGHVVKKQIVPQLDRHLSKRGYQKIGGR